MTYDEFEKKYIGKAVDYDGVAGVQCVDLVDQYLDNCFGITGVWCDGAKDLYNNFETYPALVKAFDRIPNTRDLIVQKGDIVIWGGGSWGHTGIGNGEGDKDWFVTLEENTLGRHEPTQLIKHRFDSDIANPCLGVLRPKIITPIKSIYAQGIDVSMHQREIDFAKVKNAGVKFVIIRCNNWDDVKNCVVKDPYFEQNYKNAKAAGLDVGAYYYTWNTTAGGAMDDAALCMKYLSGKKFEYPIYFDLEWQKAFAKGKATCDAMVRAFCDRLEDNGYFAGLYISRIPLQTYISPDVASSYSLWIAEYGTKCNYDGLFGMWQYSDNGRISGISGDVDLDECYVDYPGLIKSGGFNGYPKQEPEKPLDTVIWYKRGDKDKGNDHSIFEVKQRLKGLGYNVDDTGGFGGGTENAVKDVQLKKGYKPTGEIGENFVKLVMRQQGVLK